MMNIFAHIQNTDKYITEMYTTSEHVFNQYCINFRNNLY